MVRLKRTNKIFWKIKIATSRLVESFGQDLLDEIRRPANENQQFASFYKHIKLFFLQRIKGITENKDFVAEVGPTKEFLIAAEKPTVFISCCTNQQLHGGFKFNGGIKEFNYLAKLLKKHGYKTHIVTYDGTYENWLIEHQLHISLEEFRNFIRYNSNIRCVTSWATANAFIKESPSLYFWDMELAYTDHHHFPALAKLYQYKIHNTASISRPIQAWHMANFQRPCILLPNFRDETVWFPILEQQKDYRVGLMDEGIHTEAYLRLIEKATIAKGLNLEFIKIQGLEVDVLEAMRTCQVFLGMNLGKDPLWGEGCPRTVIEALSAGCVVIAFDVLGNREIILDNFNGFLIPRNKPELMAEALIHLYTYPNEIKRLFNNSIAFLEACHKLDARWSAVKDFLQLT